MDDGKMGISLEKITKKEREINGFLCRTGKCTVHYGKSKRRQK